MFTGIVEARGRIARLDRIGERVDLEVEAPETLAHDVRVGDSISVDGCCLTVTARAGTLLSFQAVPETLRCTALRERARGDRVNLERALPAGGRLDGHLVQGHVDGVGRVDALIREGSDVRMRIGCSAEIARLLVPKGSVAVDGVSLTVVEPDPAGFWVALIPHTLEVTTLGERPVGAAVNLEADVLGKYVVQYLERLDLHPVDPVELRMRD
jgi:riboflavin synthase alpha subunit